MVWIQYSTVDGSQTGTNSVQVSDADLAALGKAQIEYDGDPTNMMVDITQTPPVVIPVPPSPSPTG
jgi:hypothetical protein